MTLSENEIGAIVKGATGTGEASVRAPWAVAMRRMLNALADSEFGPEGITPLVKLCDVGARYGWQEWEATASRQLLVSLSNRAKQSLRRELRRNLTRITAPCLDLERESFGLALNALGLPAGNDPKSADLMFLGKKPSDRLFSMFKKFPVLAQLWSQLMLQWRDHVTEILERFANDRVALSKAFFGGKAIGPIVNLRCGLSDSHHGGRTVALLQFEAGPVIYKPRSGEGEWEWHSLVQWMNENSFRPKLKAGRVLRRAGYCWMEYITAASCKDAAAARRFHERIGALIAAAYLLRAVDCHRENLIAAGEYPVLIDTDALWHVSSVTKTQDPLSQLYRTGFFPNSDPRSLQSRSSALGRAARGKHLVRMGAKPPRPARYRREIVTGFSKAWRFFLGTRERREAFARRLRRIRWQERRWIYLATERYAAIRITSIQPSVLRLATERDLLITRLCTRNSVSPAVVQAEINAVKRLDIPYFLRRTKESMPSDQSTAPNEVVQSLKRVLSQGAY